MNKVYPSSAAAVADIPDGASVMIGGFGLAGLPENLLRALAEHGARGLTIISNTAGRGDLGVGRLFKGRQVRRFIGCFPVPGQSQHFEEQFLRGEVEYECLPQGTFSERIRAGGAGIAAFYTPTGVGTILAEGKEHREFNGRPYILEHALTADYALIKGYRGDRWGNLVYRGTSRNFNVMMATAARVTIAEVEEVVELGALDPEAVVTPGIFVQRIVRGEVHEKAWVD